MGRDSLVNLGIETSYVVRSVDFGDELWVEIDHKNNDVIHAIWLQLGGYWQMSKYDGVERKLLGGFDACHTGRFGP